MIRIYALVNYAGDNTFAGIGFGKTVATFMDHICAGDGACQIHMGVYRTLELHKLHTVCRSQLLGAVIGDVGDRYAPPHTYHIYTGSSKVVRCITVCYTHKRQSAFASGKGLIRRKRFGTYTTGHRQLRG